MNTPRRIIDPYRTLRRSFVDICEGNFQAALLLDYFVSMEHALDEARSQGEKFGQWRELSLSRAGEVMLTRPSKHTIRMSIRALVELGFIEGHAANALNRGGYDREHSNRFRLCREALMDALRSNDAGQFQPASDSAGQNRPAVLVKIDQQSRSNLTSMPGKFDHMNQLESVNESAAAATEPPPPPIDPIQLYEAWAGRLPTKLELRQVLALLQKYGEVAVSNAFNDAALKGGKSLKYVAAILQGDKVPAVAVAPVYVAEDEREVISLEERRAMRAQYRNGGA